MTAKSPIAIINVGDLHCGSIYGLHPPEFNSSDDREVPQNRDQRWLWWNWQDFWHRTSRYNVAAVVFNGDLIEGSQPKSRGGELCLSRIADQCLAAQMCIESAMVRFGKKKPPVFLTAGCVVPGHKVLTADLRWVPVETLQVGDKLLAPSEESEGPHSSRSWRWSEVTFVSPVVKDCVELVLASGKILRCTSDHPWLVKNGNSMVWTTASNLKTGDIHPSSLVRLMPEWEEETSFDAGYLSGFFDGEGTLGIAKHKSKYGNTLCVGASQNDGAVQSKVLKLLDGFGISHGLYSIIDRPTRIIQLRGGKSKQLEFLGRFRPVRLLNNLTEAEDYLLGSVKCLGYDRVVSVKHIGLQTVIGLSTSTKTYMVDGFASHNTDYHVGTVGQDEEAIAVAVHAEHYKGTGAGQRIHEVLNLEINGLVANFAHHIGVSNANKAGVIDKEITASILAELAGHSRTDVLIRNHVHTYRQVGSGYRHGATSPAWQLQTKFTRRGGVFQQVPDIGGLVVWLDGQAKQNNDDPVRIQPILYPLQSPQVEIVRL